MAATVQANYYSGASEGTGATAETGIKYNKEDTQTGTTPVTKPNIASTAYSWLKSLALRVTAGGGSTSISNRKIRIATALAAGLTLFFKDGGATYAQSTSGNAPADNGTTNDATPATFTAMTTTFQSWDAASAAAVNSARNGNLVLTAAGVSNLYVGGAGNAITLPNIEMQYDEA